MSWKLKAVVLDWAGTMIDHGSLAPMGSFVEAFARFGVDLTVDEARQPMGMAKRAHIAALLALPRVSAAWEAAHGHAPAEADIDAVYEVFVPMNLEVAARYADLVPGAADVARRLRELGLKIGSSTGYTHEIMDRILPVAAAQGYEPDCLICAGETAEGRPTPLMMYRCFLELGVWPAWCCVKVDDTDVGIAEGLNAGAWTVGVALTGNLCGLPLAELEALRPLERERRRQEATERLLAAGAHYVIDGVSDLLPIVHSIAGRLTRGERP
jgi:phosphonoacetaldehyde hydrolase